MDPWFAEASLILKELTPSLAKIQREMLREPTNDKYKDRVQQLYETTIPSNVSSDSKR